MLEGKTISFVGSGNMAEAIIGGLLAKKMIEPEGILAIGPREARGVELQERYGVRISTKNINACAADIIVLSIKPKPHIRNRVFEELRAEIRSETLIISIMAGVAVKTISDALGTQNVVRSMPNTPGKIGRGITGWTSNGINKDQREAARTIIAALGKEVFLEDEDQLHIVTGVSGTGPADVVLFMESMIDAAVQRGMSRHHARLFVVKTFRGMAELVSQNPNTHLAEFRDQVTSPGGTTAAAIYAMQKGGIRTVIADGVHAACEKSIEVGKK